MRLKTIRSVLLCAYMVLLMAVPSMAADQYVFEVDNVSVLVGKEAGGVIKELGKAKTERTTQNGAAGAKDSKIYVYDGFSVYTTRNAKKQEIICAVELTSDEVSTKEGLAIGQPSSEVMKLYPAAVEENGIYTISGNKSRLQVDCGYDNEEVEKISYDILTK